MFSHVTTARPNLPRPPSLAEVHLPRPPQLGNCLPKRSEIDLGSRLSGLQAHLANIQPPSLGGKFQSLKSLGGNSGGGSQASSSTGKMEESRTQIVHIVEIHFYKMKWDIFPKL